MFCQNCGKEINDGIKFCPECGAVTSENGLGGDGSHTFPENNEVFVRGYKCAGNSKYYAFTFYVPGAAVVLGGLLCESMPILGLLIILAAVVFACIIRKVFKQSIMYDDSQKYFIYNAHSHLKFTIKKIAIADIKKVRIRYVKIGLIDSRYSLNDPGKYHVISFDAADSKKSLSVWFSKNGNAEEFIPVIENAFNQNEMNVVIDRKEELIKHAKFLKESEN